MLSSTGYRMLRMRVSPCDWDYEGFPPKWSDGKPIEKSVAQELRWRVPFEMEPVRRDSWLNSAYGGTVLVWGPMPTSEFEDVFVKAHCDVTAVFRAEALGVPMKFIVKVLVPCVAFQDPDVDPFASSDTLPVDPWRVDSRQK